MVKLVTVLFADVVGSTAQAERMSPDETRALMTDFFQAMAEEIEAEGGTVERIIGDAVMADFGVPVAHEDDPLRAVRAARRMLRRLREWNTGRAPDEQIKVRIGVNTGQVSAAGGPDADLLVTGDAVNVAARLEQNAEPGSILVGERTGRAIAKSYALTAKRLVLKGKTEPVSAFLVGDELSVGDPLRAAAGDPLVGRTKELEGLYAVMEQVTREGRARLTTVVGDAGIGKTRLVEHFVREARDRWTASVVHGRCLPYGEGVTLWPLGEILKSEARLLASDSARAAFRKIQEFVRARLGPETLDEARAIRALASTIGLHEDGAEASDPRQIYRDLLTTWRSLFRTMAAGSPLVVVVEDLHWADPTMLDVLSYLADQLDARVLFVCPCRPELFEKSSGVAAARSYSSVVLQPLSNAESEELLAGYVGDDFPPALEQRILQRSEGNPFYLREMVYSLQDRGLLDAERNWSGARNDEDVDVPDNVQSVILSRIDVLPAREKRILQAGSVVGRTFWTGALETLIEDDEAMEDALLSLERRGLVAQRLGSSLAGQREYAFSHVLIRDVAYATLPRRAGAESHTRTAQWLGEATRDRVNEYAELIAHHYDAAYRVTNEAALRASAREWWLVATNSAMRRAAASQATALAARAVGLSLEGAERGEALELLGDVHHFRHDGDAAWDAYRAAIGECEGDGSESMVGRLAAKAAILTTRWEGTLKTPVPVQEVRVMIEKGMSALGDSQRRERSLLLSSKAFLQGQGYEQSDSAGRTAATQALEIAEELGDPDLMSTALDASAFWLLPEAKYGDIDRIERRRLELVSRLVDSREISDVYAVAALSATFMGRYSEAVELSDQAVERSRGMDPGQYLYCLAWRVLARFLGGDWDGALADQDEVETLDSIDSEGLPLPYAAAPYATALLCHELRGETSEADRYLDLLTRYRARQAAREAPIGTTRMLVARTLAHRRDYEQAWTWINLARSPYLGANIEAACELAATEDDRRAAEILHLVRMESERSRNPFLDVHADRLEGRLAARRREPNRAVDLLQRAATSFSTSGAKWDEAWSRLLLARALADSGGDGALRHAAAALQVFERLGSIRESEEARALLSARGQVADDPPHVR
jgi:class 3 adenylate cyclase